MSEKRELVLKAFRGESVDRVPVGFWHHYTNEAEWLHGFENPEIIDKNKDGHKKFIEEVKPDFVKLMSDGFFAYPQPVFKDFMWSCQQGLSLTSIMCWNTPTG